MTWHVIRKGADDSMCLLRIFITFDKDCFVARDRTQDMKTTSISPSAYACSYPMYVVDGFFFALKHELK